MKKGRSWAFLGLTISAFVGEIYFAITRYSVAQKELDALAAMPNVSGMDYLNVPIGELVLGVLAIAVVGSILALFSCRSAHTRAIRIASYVLLGCFILPILLLLVGLW